MVEAALQRTTPDFVLSLPEISRLLGTLGRADDRQSGTADR
jgi:hypothetical protein